MKLATRVAAGLMLAPVGLLIAVVVPAHRHADADARGDRRPDRGVAAQMTDLFGWNRADFSPCRTWRYTLRRRWGDGPAMLVIGLNPSTADETLDDPTIRRCISFAKREGCAGLTMANLFAYRATDPRRMMRASDPIGPENDDWLRHLGASHALRVAAWGAHGTYHDRAAVVLALLRPFGPLSCLGVTSKGHPRHPLYLPGNAPLVLYAR